MLAASASMLVTDFQSALPPPPCMSDSDVVIRVEGLGKQYALHDRFGLQTPS
jgi:hypothetical protein